jgi:hypothetical protein
MGPWVSAGLGAWEPMWSRSITDKANHKGKELSLVNRVHPPKQGTGDPS